MAGGSVSIRPLLEQQAEGRLAEPKFSCQEGKKRHCPRKMGRYASWDPFQILPFHLHTPPRFPTSAYRSTPPPPKDPPPYHPRDLIIPAHAAPNKFGAGGSLGNLNGPQSHGHVNGVQSAPLPPSFPSTNAQGQRICRRRSANMWKNGDRGLGGDHVCCKKVERVERRRKLARQPLAAQTANAVGATHNAEQTPPGKMSRSHAPPPPPPIPPPPPPPVDDNEADDILAAESGCPSPPPDPVPPLEDLVSTHSGGGDALLLPFNDPLRPPS
ncbi:hypothetical protein PLEOSDRAFT_1100853 [Pleurotus ostreatus PC15]|uniref:Uncharacterized protein n=1 Tax=Pleurotus ostreatus (strain PC15) TaxID=1137138 RepID=A0A067NWF0_PLEO1|nr:hypothetical protein PLEOSDRAFT_1100853 [Pleurotus ostreatus PC15]